ncbi:unnamed protein product [Diatraea saccharalis]|uniref:Uncharacterized protein n=1 Tax=Diatraea saccharalis TaxID=40085 RepID=A0A9N9RG13_9NEOP|nr:unnamed protein product [Diatraea saccharalis]
MNIILFISLIQSTYYFNGIVCLKNKGDRIKKCSDNNSRLDDFLSKTLKVFDTNEQKLNEFSNENLSVRSECLDSRNVTCLFDGLLIHHDVPHSHWLKYKVTFFFYFKCTLYLNQSSPSPTK